MRSTETDPDAGDLKLAKTAVQAIGLGSILSAGAVVSDEIVAGAVAKEFSYATEAGNANQGWSFNSGL